MEAQERRPRYIPKCLSVKITLAIISVLLGLMGFAIFGCVLKNWNAGNDDEFYQCTTNRSSKTLNWIYIYIQSIKISFTDRSCIWPGWSYNCRNIASFTRKLQIWCFGRGLDKETGAKSYICYFCYHGSMLNW